MKIQSPFLLAELTLATLCDIVMDESEEDRSDNALVRAVGKMNRRLAEAEKLLKDAQACLIARLDPNGPLITTVYNRIDAWLKGK